MLIGHYPPIPQAQRDLPVYPLAPQAPLDLVVATNPLPSGGFHWPSLSIPHWQQLAHDRFVRQKQSQANRYAEQFCKATIDQFGTDEKAVKRILKDVHRLRLHAEFNQAVVEAARKRDKDAQGVVDLLEQEFAANPVEKPFKNAVRKECLDYLHYGKNLYRPSAWDYRLYGMYRSMADFAKVCKQHPVMSAGVIGSVAMLGHMYPFLGAVSGVAILAWAGTFTAVNEILARRQGQTKAEQAAYYQASGENLAAFAITAIGGKGIKEGTHNGLKVYNRTVAQSAQPSSTILEGVKARWRGLWNATKARAEGEHKTNALESALFVSGLFDNVLLPFNWLADKLDNQPNKT